MTIEERAEKIVRTANSVWFCPDSIEECVIQQEIVLAIKVATEQDSIARKEEREKCIRIAQNAICCRCIGKSKVDKCTIREGCEKRGQLWYIRQAMEGGKE